MQDLAQQPGQQRDKGHADQGNAAARDQLLHALALAAGVILSIALQQVDARPRHTGHRPDRPRWSAKYSTALLKNSISPHFCRLFCALKIKLFGCIFIRQVDFVQVKTFVLCDYLLPFPAQGG